MAPSAPALTGMSRLAADPTLPGHVRQCHTKRVPVELTAEPFLLYFSGVPSRLDPSGDLGQFIALD
jgi:hypothetical protein